jgi:hypothetical protein
MRFPTKWMFPALFVGGVVLAGQVPPKPQTSEAQLAALRKQVTALNEDLASLKKEVGRLNFGVFQLQTRPDSTSKVELDPTTPHQFQRVDTSNGTFLVSLDSIEPYLDAYRGDQPGESLCRNLQRVHSKASLGACVRLV